MSRTNLSILRMALLPYEADRIRACWGLAVPEVVANGIIRDVVPVRNNFYLAIAIDILSALGVAFSTQSAIVVLSAIVLVVSAAATIKFAIQLFKEAKSLHDWAAECGHVFFPDEAQARRYRGY